MSGLVPKEKLTAYQRWELAAFDEAEQAAKRAAEAAAAAAASEVAAHEAIPGAVDDSTAVDQPVLTLPTAAEIERMHLEAHEEGYAAGFAEGKTKGHEEGYAAGHKEGKETALASASKIDAVLQYEYRGK